MSNIEKYIELAKIENFVWESLHEMPMDHSDRPFVKSLLNSITNEVNTRLELPQYPRTHEEYVLGLDQLSDVLGGNSPEAKEFQKLQEDMLETQRLQGLLPDTFGERIAFHRKRLGISQRDLARLTDTHYSVINKLEKNKRKPTPKMMDRLTGKLLLPRSYIIELVHL